MNRRQFASRFAGMGLASNLAMREAWAQDPARLRRADGQGEAATSPPAEISTVSSVPQAVEVIPHAFPSVKTGGMYLHNYYLPHPSSTPMYPAWSPDGQEVAFSLQGSIWRMKLADRIAHEITASPTYDASPAWSPDGRWIVYISEVDSQNINLNIVNLATGDSRPLTQGRDVNLDPAWSPDGSRIAFVSTHPDGWFNVLAMAIANGVSSEPIPLTISNDYGRERLYYGRFDLHIQPRWSPDGKEIVLLSNRGIAMGSGAIWRMPVESNGMARAKMIRREETLYQSRPDWSPDGSRIIYSSFAGGQFNHLYLLPSGGGEPYQLTFGDWDRLHPRWSPDGMRIIYVSNQRGLPELRILETFGGGETQLEIRRKVYKRPMGALDVRVTDAATLEVVPARIYLRASDGKVYTPDAAVHRMGRAREHLFYSTGNFRLEVPVGTVKVEAASGLEYQPTAGEAMVRPNDSTSLTLPLSRISYLAQKGWHSGSDHVHLNYGGVFLNTPESVLAMAAAEDLSIVGAVVANKDNRILDHQYFRGGLDPRSNAKRLLYFNQEYRPAFWGHLTFLNLTSHLISPFATGYAETAIESMYPSNTDILLLAREQGAIGGYAHPFDVEPSTSDYGHARGLPVDAALGALTYMEISCAAHDFETSSVWHRLLNCGFKITAIGGEDSEVDLFRTAVIGSNRAYAYLGPKLDWSRWIEAIRKGATFATNGPLLEFSVGGRMLGEEIHLPLAGGTLPVQGSMKCIVPVEKVEVLCNGNVVMSVPTLNDGRAASFHQRIAVQRSGWYTLRAYTTRPVHPIDANYVFAETNPIFIYCGGRPIRSAADADYFVKWIDAISRLAEGDAGWRSPREKAHVLDQFAEARRVYINRGREADAAM